MSAGENSPSPVTTLFLDIGGVLLTNGWDRQARRRAAETFHLDYEEMDERHHLTYDTYEAGKVSLEDYLGRVVFYQERPFTRQAFEAFMYQQSRPYPQMIELFGGLKRRYGLKVAAVSNEGRELNAYRIAKFHLDRFIDFFVSSSFVHFRKPDVDIYRVALDIVQASPEQVAYVDDRALFVEVAGSLGIRSLRHTDYETTCSALADVGLSLAGWKDASRERSNSQ